jgi:hypothetical protein
MNRLPNLALMPAGKNVCTTPFEGSCVIPLGMSPGGLGGSVGTF